MVRGEDSKPQVHAARQRNNGTVQQSEKDETRATEASQPRPERACAAQVQEVCAFKAEFQQPSLRSSFSKSRCRGDGRRICDGNSDGSMTLPSEEGCLHPGHFHSGQPLAKLGLPMLLNILRICAYCRSS